MSRIVVLRVAVGVVERVEDSGTVVGPPGVEDQRCRRPFVPHDPLHHVRRYAVVHQPRGVRVPKVVKPEPAGLMTSNVLHGLGLRPQLLGVLGAGIVGPLRLEPAVDRDHRPEQASSRPHDRRGCHRSVRRLHQDVQVAAMRSRLQTAYGIKRAVRVRTVVDRLAYLGDVHRGEPGRGQDARRAGSSASEKGSPKVCFGGPTARAAAMALLAVAGLSDQLDEPRTGAQRLRNVGERRDGVGEEHRAE